MGRFCTKRCSVATKVSLAGISNKGAATVVTEAEGAALLVSCLGAAERIYQAPPPTMAADNSATPPQPLILKFICACSDKKVCLTLTPTLHHQVYMVAQECFRIK